MTTTASSKRIDIDIEYSPHNQDNNDVYERRNRPQWYHYNSADNSYRNAYHRYDKYDFALIGKQD